MGWKGLQGDCGGGGWGWLEGLLQGRWLAAGAGGVGGAGGGGVGGLGLTL